MSESLAQHAAAAASLDGRAASPLRLFVRSECMWLVCSRQSFLMRPAACYDGGYDACQVFLRCSFMLAAGITQSVAWRI